MSGQHKHFQPSETITQPTSSFQHHLPFPLILFSKYLAQKHTNTQPSNKVPVSQTSFLRLYHFFGSPCLLLVVCPRQMSSAEDR